MRINNSSGNKLRKVLKREPTSSPALFEYFMNENIYNHFVEENEPETSTAHAFDIKKIKAFMAAGYDYATIIGSEFTFPQKDKESAHSISQSGPGPIIDRESFKAYSWPDPKQYDYSKLRILSRYLEDDKYFMVESPDGILESAINLIGYENLCIMLIEDRDLLKEIFDQIGSRILGYYEQCLKYDSVGFVMVNDDWGFHQQTLISPKDLREFVFPWQKKIVEAAHKVDVQAILHSCGNLSAVWEDIIEYMGFDGKHSYEDKILPVEEAYKKYGLRIAILGGIDMDFLCRSDPNEIRKRVEKICEMSREGGYAIGSGNSIPEYVPIENYLALIDVPTCRTNNN